MHCSAARISIIRNTAVALCVSAALWAALFTFASAEVIRSFSSDIVINSDSSFTVTETIVYDFEGASRHGIYRNITDVHPQEASAWYKTRKLDLTLLSVMKNGVDEPYTLESYDGLSVKIGDPYKYVVGEEEYKIIYRVAGGLTQYGDEVELYWNVTGDEWDVIIQNVFATVKTVWDGGLSLSSDCYVGGVGSTERCTSVRDSATVSLFSWNQPVYAEHITIAQQLNFPGEITVLESINYLVILPLVTILWLLGLGVWIYLWRTKYRVSASIIAQYEPLSDFKPLFTGVLFDEVLDARDITAGILYLAQQGYITIRQTTEKIIFFKVNDYEVTLKKPVPLSDSSFDDEIISLLFDYAQAHGGVVKLSDIKKDQKKLIKNIVVLSELRSAVSDEMHKQGFIERVTGKSLAIFAGVSATLIGLHVFIGVITIPIAVIFSVTAIVAIAGFGYTRRTTKGYEALNYLKGFKDFLSTTEKERYKFHNAPAQNAEQFMEYLPYAIAFGVEKEWAEVFKDIQITPPDWYHSETSSAFNAAAFATSVQSFSTSLSSSSGASPSSGGGSAGGGGGGGGGGSW